MIDRSLWNDAHVEIRGGDGKFHSVCGLANHEFIRSGVLDCRQPDAPLSVFAKIKDSIYRMQGVSEQAGSVERRVGLVIGSVLGWVAKGMAFSAGFWLASVLLG